MERRTIRQCLMVRGRRVEEVGGKNSIVNMEKTQTYLNAAQKGLKKQHEDRTRKGP